MLSLPPTRRRASFRSFTRAAPQSASFGRLLFFACWRRPKSSAALPADIAISKSHATNRTSFSEARCSACRRRWFATRRSNICEICGGEAFVVPSEEVLTLLRCRPSYIRPPVSWHALLCPRIVCHVLGCELGACNQHL